MNSRPLIPSDNWRAGADADGAVHLSGVSGSRTAFAADRQPMRGAQCGHREPLAGVQKLRDAVDLIVMPAVGEPEQLAEEFGEPGRLFGE